MNLLFHIFSKKSAAGRWWLGLFLALAVAFPGCKQLGLHDDEPHDDGLRRNDMALPARQARAKETWPAEKKPAEDPLMSDEAQRVYHDLD